LGLVEELKFIVITIAGRLVITIRLRCMDSAFFLASIVITIGWVTDVSASEYARIASERGRDLVNWVRLVGDFLQAQFVFAFVHNFVRNVFLGLGLFAFD